MYSEKACFPADSRREKQAFSLCNQFFEQQQIRSIQLLILVDICGIELETTQGAGISTSHNRAQYLVIILIWLPAACQVTGNDNGTILPFPIPIFRNIAACWNPARLDCNASCCPSCNLSAGPLITNQFLVFRNQFCNRGAFLKTIYPAIKRRVPVARSVF